MLRSIINFFYYKPGRVTMTGEAVTKIGMGLLVAGAWGKYATGGLDIFATLFGRPATIKTLAEMYPNLTLWWIPESVIGWFFTVVLIVAGLVINFSGRGIDRNYRTRY